MQCLLRMSCQKKIIRRRICSLLNGPVVFSWSQWIMFHKVAGCKLFKSFHCWKALVFFGRNGKIQKKKQRFYSSFKQPLCHVKSEICRLQWYLQTSLLLSSDFPLFHRVLDPSHLAWCGKKSSHGPLKLPCDTQNDDNGVTFSKTIFCCNMYLKVNIFCYWSPSFKRRVPKWNEIRDPFFPSQTRIASRFEGAISFPLLDTSVKENGHRRKADLSVVCRRWFEHQRERGNDRLFDRNLGCFKSVWSSVFWEKKQTSEVCNSKRFNLHTCVHRHGRGMMIDTWLKITGSPMAGPTNLHLKSPVFIVFLVLGGLVLQQKLPEHTYSTGRKKTKIKEKTASSGLPIEWFCRFKRKGASTRSRFKKFSSSRTHGVDWAILMFHKPGKPWTYHIWSMVHVLCIYKHIYTYIWPNYNISPAPFPWNKGISLTKPPFGVRSCEVATIWPDIYIYIYMYYIHISYIL